MYRNIRRLKGIMLLYYGTAIPNFHHLNSNNTCISSSEQIPAFLIQTLRNQFTSVISSIISAFSNHP